MVYIPNYFRIQDKDEIEGIMQANSFGILVTVQDQLPLATHLPFFYDAEYHALFAHMARANSQWQNLDGQTVLVIFSGPHAYISPSWYQVPHMVPTWNYTAVHVYGVATRVDDRNDLMSLMNNLVRVYEPDSPLLQQTSESFYQNMLQDIVGFRINITDIQATAKLSQNKPLEARWRVVEKLRERGTEDAQGVAEGMIKEINRATRNQGKGGKLVE